MVINGADRTLLSHNLITGNQLFGLTLIDYCIGAPQDCADRTLAIDPYPDGNRVVGNRFVSNQANVIFIPGTGKDNCFERNRPTPFAPDVVLPAPLIPQRTPSVHTASRPSNAPGLGVPLTPIALRTRFAYARRPRSSRSAR